jgi:molecular chaperone DnaK
MKSEIEAEMSTVREAMNNEDVEAIRTGVDKLQAVMQQAGAAMYQQQGGDAGPGAPGADGAGPSGSANGAADDDVVEGEFSEA